MAISTNITQDAPYYDDFVTSSNDNRNYLRILFKPGVAVQARELNQLQTQIQNQIDKFGRNVFKENTRVLGGDLTLNTDVQTINIVLGTGYNTDATVTSEILNQTVKNADGTVEAKVVGFNVVSGAEYKLFLQYTKSTDTSTGGSVTSFKSPIYTREFVSSDTIQLSTTSVQIGIVSDVGHAAEYSIARGVFFVLGSFVVCEAQRMLIDLGPVGADGTRLNYTGSAILLATENVVGIASDANLYDNALGTPNSGAPGADRYTITLSLRLLTDNVTVLGSGFNSINAIEETGFNGNAVTLSTVQDSAVIQTVSTSYSELGERLARRTYEESGNYTLNPYVIDIRPHENTGTNRGKFLASDLTTPGDPGKLVIDIEPNTAYVYGVRHEFLSSIPIDLNRARDTYNGVYQVSTGEKVDFQARKGNYILADNITGKFDTATTYELFETKFAFDHSSPAERGASSPSVRIGECTVSNVEYDGNKYRVYLNSVSMAAGRELKEAKHLADAAFGASALDFSATSGSDTGSSGEGFKLKEPGAFGEIFPIGRNGVKDIFELKYIERTASSTITRNTSNTAVSVNLNSSGGSGISSSAGKTTEWFSDNPNDYIIISAISGEVLPHSATPTISGSNISLTLDGSGTDDNVVVISPKRVIITDFTGAKKTVATGQVTSTITGLAQNTNVSLAQKDIIEITSITISDYTDSDGNTSTKQIKDKFILDDGQRATDLLLGNVTYVGETLSTTTVPTNSTLTIDFKYFAHGSNSIPFTVEAYPITDFDSKGHATGANETVSFSKLRQAGGAGIISDTIDFRDTGVLNVDPNGFMSVKVDYYLPRYSNLSLGIDGNFIVTDGKSGITPYKPEYPPNSLPLFDFYLNPYTHDIGRGFDGTTQPIDCKRYTMRDINFLENRIQNLEYYTSLSLLESQADNITIFDALEGERFKNGILVDSFTGHNIGNVNDPGYNIAIDYEAKILRPAYEQVNMNLYLPNRNPGDLAGISAVDSDQAEPVSRLPSNARNALVNQPYASTAINVNPFELASFVGNIVLSPSSDEWHSTERLDDVVINFDNNYDQLLADFNKKNQNVLGTVWNSWSYNWTGSNRTETNKYYSTETWSVWEGNETKRTTGVNVYVEKTGTKSRAGQETFVEAKTINKSFGDTHIKTAYVPFIRSRKIYFNVTDLKPNTRVIPFFDHVNVDLYCRQDANFVNYLDGQNNVSYEPITNDSDSGVTPSDILSSSSAGLTTDSEGSLSGFFLLPLTDELRFKSGEKTFKLIDSANEHDINATTFAETTYISRGQISTYQENIISYRVPTLATNRLTQTNDAYDKRTIRNETVGGHSGREGTTVTQIAYENIDTVCYQDPLAQSFAIPGTFTNGVYIRDIDLYFKEVGVLPIHVHLVSMENGFPTNNIIQGTKIRKSAADMVGKGSENATIATNFRFEHPIYLPSKAEFAIVVSTNSFDYTLWHSTVGENDITGERLTATNNQFKITKNPYAGVSFKSQNQSTWSPDQNTDMKFKINYVEFPVNQEFKKQFTTVLPENAAGTSITTAKATTVCLLSNQLMPTGTRVDYTLVQKSGNNTLTYNIVPGGHVQLKSQISAITSATDLRIEAKMQTQDQYVTPLIDLERMSLLVLNNVINDDITNETVKTHGSAKSRYITKKVALNQASTRLDVLFDLAKPEGTDVKVFVRADVLTAGTNTNEAFELMTGDNIPPNSGSEALRANFDEVRFKFDLTRLALLTVNNTTDNSDAPGGFTSGVNSFKEFEVKIVMLSSEPAIVPQIRNLRCVATV